MSEYDPIGFGLDIIGDIHGQLAAFEGLGKELGCRTGGDWSHPDGRRLVFIGDLVDRGPHSLETAQLVRMLCVDGSALCLLGNHELHLVEWRHGVAASKESNRKTIDDIIARRERWDPVLDFFESLPLALEFESLLKGEESPAAEPFVDNDGTWRDKIRTEGWRLDRYSAA